MNNIPMWAVGAALAVVIALLARRAGALSTSGALASILVGTVAVAAGWDWGILLVAYFLTSALLSRYRATERAARVEGRIDKHGARDAAQVFANGGVFALAAIGSLMWPAPVWQTLGAGALAASAADTWATEVGTLSSPEPRSILGFAPVPVGTSGGVTMLGSMAGIAGAGFIALLVWLVRWPGIAVVAAFSGGVLGFLIDSLIGASLQARRWCATCNEATEQRTHRCGNVTQVVGGIEWIDNDDVNTISTLSGGLLGAAIATFL